jgi:hypothetical protein
VAGITINSDMGDPIEIDLSGALDLLAHGESMLVKATPVNCSLDNTTCYFFINGNLAYETTTSVDGGFEFSITDLSLGTHRLDVAIRKDGLVTQMGNVSHIFVVEGLALLAPYDVNAEAVSHDTINVSWKQDNISVVDGWEIDRKQGIDGAWVHIATIPKDSLIAYEKKIIDLHMAYLHRKACLYAKSY